MTEDGGSGELDAFWSTVRRRHPDLDVVLVPEDEPQVEEAPPPPEPDPRLVETVPDAFDSWLARAWEAVAPAAARDQGADVVARWEPGDTADDLARVATRAADGVDEVDGQQAVAAAERFLRDDGWDGLVPPTGLPRVLATRFRDGIDEQVQVVFVPASGRLALAVRWAGIRVGRQVAGEALEGSS